MSGYDHPHSRRRLAIFALFSCALLFTLGCRLFSAEYWVHRLDDPESDPGSASLPADTNEAVSESNFGSKCLNSAGDSPCPVEACVVYKGEYTAKYEVASELFGKANPSDYQCCADFQFTNSSGVDLMAYEHIVTEFDDSWLLRLYPVDIP